MLTQVGLFGSNPLMPAKKIESVTVLPSGVSVNAVSVLSYDWDSIRVLAEKGVSYKTIAKHFKGLNVGSIKEMSYKEKWATPARTTRMRKELALKQKDALARNEALQPPAEVMKEIWKERQAVLDEKAFEISKAAMKGVSAEKASDLIKDAKDLKTMVDVARKVTGQERRENEETKDGPQMAIAVNFLRSTGPEALEPIDV